MHIDLYTAEEVQAARNELAALESRPNTHARRAAALGEARLGQLQHAYDAGTLNLIENAQRPFHETGLRYLMRAQILKIVRRKMSWIRSNFSTRSSGCFLSAWGLMGMTVLHLFKISGLAAASVRRQLVVRTTEWRTLQDTKGSHGDAIAASLDLFRRLPPHKIADNLDQLCQVFPEYADDLLGAVDQPLKVLTDKQGRQYLACDYNRDGDSYRSPWTNEYDPPLEDGTQPSAKLRELEESINDAFDVYRDQYYEGGVSSAFLWDVDDGFAGVVLLKKVNDENGSSASWDSVHVFESADRGRTANYKLTSTVMLYLDKSLQPNEQEGTKGTGQVALGGSMTRQVEVSGPVDLASAKATLSSHVCNIGRMIEDMELKIRNSLQEVYFSKTRDILLSNLRSSVGFGEQAKQRALQGELVGLLRRKAQS
ncbi:hypothetical protein ACM66B_002407 [Microbotryomycetes sp. NB124-2]